MNAEDRADYYQAHKDDPDEWGEPQAGPRRRQRMASVLSVRFAPDEVDAIRAEADRQGLSVSAFVRAAALREAHRRTDLGVTTVGRLDLQASPASGVSLAFITALPQDVPPNMAGATDTALVRSA